MSRKEYTLSALESILINKKMPKRFKLELADNISSNASKYSNNNLTSQSVSKRQNEQPLNLPTPQSKCEYYIKKIVNHHISTAFYIRSSSSDPSLIQIEKNVTVGKYKSLAELDADIKKLFLYYFENYSKNKEVYSKASALRDYALSVLKTIDPHLASQSVKTHQMPLINVKNDKPMTTEEKKDLGDNIKKLDKMQLKGIVELLKESINHDNNSKYFMFDIEQLTVRKCRELEAYVRGCLKGNYTETPKSKEEEKKKEATNVNSNNNDGMSEESDSESDESESWL